MIFFVAIISLIMLSVSTALAVSQTSPLRRVALITGSNKGIGKEIARKIGQEEDTLCILGCRNEKLGITAVDELKNDGCKAVEFVLMDLDDINTIHCAARFIEEKYGRCDVLVNNAAVCFNDATLYGKVPYTSFQKQADITVRTNFFGTLSLTRAILPLLRKSSSPRIINIASSAGRLTIIPSRERRQDFSSKDLQMSQLEDYMHQFVKDVQDGTHAANGWPNTCYGASKVAIIAMTKILARDEPLIMVNSVDPGYCATDQNDNQGYIPSERGATTPFLLATSPDNKHFTGVHWFEEKEIEW